MRVLKPAVAPLGLEADNTKQDALETADEAGDHVHVVLHDLRIVLDRRRHPADLPDLRDAGGRAARRAWNRARSRHPPPAPRADVPVRGDRPTTLPRRSSEPSSVSPSRTGWCSRSRARSRPVDEFQHLVRREADELRPCVRDRRAAHARRRRLLRLARQPDEHRGRDPQPSEDATEKKRRRRWVLGIVGLLVGVALASSGVSSERRRRARARRLDRDPQPRSDPARLSARPGGSNRRRASR